MNIKDGEEEQDMEISEKEDGTACNIYRTLWKTNTKKETWLLFDICEMSQMFTSRYRLRPRL